MMLSIPFTAIIKEIFDHVDSLEPFGFLLGEPPQAAVKNPHGDFVAVIKKEVKQRG